MYVGTFADNFYALNADGTEKWAYKTGAVLISSPVIDIDGTVYVGAIDSAISAIYGDSGGLSESIWPVSGGDAMRSHNLSEDIDGDLIADAWELAYGLDPSNSDDANEDFDGEGLLNIVEYGIGTDPELADSDGDGVINADEYLNLTDPQDPNSY